MSNIQPRDQIWPPMELLYLAHWAISRPPEIGGLARGSGLLQNREPLGTGGHGDRLQEGKGLIQLRLFSVCFAHCCCCSPSSLAAMDMWWWWCGSSRMGHEVRAGAMLLALCLSQSCYQHWPMPHVRARAAATACPRLDQARKEPYCSHPAKGTRWV